MYNISKFTHIIVYTSLFVKFQLQLLQYQKTQVSQKANKELMNGFRREEAAEQDDGDHGH